MKKNKGYTLIEMIIVIAIMAILSGVAVVTLNVIQQAKCNAAVNTFDNQISNLWIQTKALSQGKVQSTSDRADAGGYYPMCMIVMKNVDDSDDIKNGSYEMILGYEDGSGFIKKESLAVLTEIVSIRYTPSPGSTYSAVTGADGTTTQMLIEFNKSDGSVKYGAGTYDIIYNNSVVASIYLDSVTGNHYVK